MKHRNAELEILFKILLYNQCTHPGTATIDPLPLISPPLCRWLTWTGLGLPPVTNTTDYVQKVEWEITSQTHKLARKESTLLTTTTKLQMLKTERQIDEILLR